MDSRMYDRLAKDIHKVLVILVFFAVLGVWKATELIPVTLDLIKNINIEIKLKKE